MVCPNRCFFGNRSAAASYRQPPPHPRLGTVAGVVLELARRYDVPIRFVSTLEDHPEHALTNTLYTGFYGAGIYLDLWEELRSLDAESVEIMVHPAYVDADLQDVSSYTDYREKELALLTALSLPDDMTPLTR